MYVKPKTLSEMTPQEIRERADEIEVSVEEYQRLARPFPPGVEAEARRIVSRYRMFVRWVAEEGCYFAGCEEYGYLCGDGETRADAIEMASDGMVGVVGYELENGETPAVPLADEPQAGRAVHVDVELSTAEQSDFEQLARREGFRGVGDYLRHAALARR